MKINNYATMAPKEIPQFQQTKLPRLETLRVRRKILRMVLAVFFRILKLCIEKAKARAVKASEKRRTKKVQKAVKKATKGFLFPYRSL